MADQELEARLARLERKIDWLAQALHQSYRRADDVVYARNNGGIKAKLHVWPYPEPNAIAGAALPNLGGNPNLDRDTFIEPARSDDPTP